MNTRDMATRVATASLAALLPSPARVRAAPAQAPGSEARTTRGRQTRRQA